MKEQDIKVLMIEPRKKPRVAFLNTSVKAFGCAISIGADEPGEIGVKKIDTGIYVIYNKGRAFSGLEANRRIGKDILAGVIYIIAVDEAYFPRSLNDDEIKKYTHKFIKKETFTEEDIIKNNLRELFAM